MPNVSFRSTGLIEIDQPIARSAACGQDADWQTVSGAISALAVNNADSKRVGNRMPAAHTAIEANIPALARELHVEVVALVVEIDELRRRASPRRW